MRASIGLLALLLVTSPAAAQDWRQQLRDDLVQTAGGKMVYDEFGILKIEDPGLRVRSVAGEGSRRGAGGRVDQPGRFRCVHDGDVHDGAAERLAEAYQVPASQFLQGYDFTKLESLIGNADLELNLFMTREGMQFEWIDTTTGQRTRLDDDLG